MADYPEVELGNVTELGVTFKKGKAKVSFEVPPGPALLRLLYLGLTAQPLNVVISSPQAEMDLKLTPVNIKTGEVEE